jgi:perosamine synthetase
MKLDNVKGLRFSGNERDYLDKVLSTGFAAGSDGTMVEKLEKMFADIHNAKFCIGANSGTSTLHMALSAFGVGEGDEVIIPGLTVAMCGYAVWHCNATPVFADIKEDTFLISPDDIERKITEKTKAIMPVHIYGLMCDMSPIMKIADEHNLYVVEDSAECYLAADDNKRLAGTVGHVGSWSLENSKHISCGDGGIVTTDDEFLAKRMRQFGGLGFKNLSASTGKVRIDKSKFQDPDWERHDMMAYNYRLPEIAAAVALAQLERIDHFCKLRILMGESYLDVINNTKTNILIPQYVPDGYRHSYFTFGALFNKDETDISWYDFRKEFIRNGGDGIYAAWKTVPDEPAFSANDLGYGNIPIAKRLQKNLMQFTTNQITNQEREIQSEALYKTIQYFQ